MIRKYQMLKCALGGKPSFFFWGSRGAKKERNFSFKSSIGSFFPLDGIFPSLMSYQIVLRRRVTVHRLDTGRHLAKPETEDRLHSKRRRHSFLRLRRRAELLRIPLFLANSPIKGRVDIFRNAFTGEIK